MTLARRLGLGRRKKERKSRRNSIGSTSSLGWGCFPVGERRTKQRRKMRREEQEKNGEEQERWMSRSRSNR